MATPGRSPCVRRALRDRASPEVSSRKGQQMGCRFIANRTCMDFDVANYMLAKENLDNEQPVLNEEYRKQLAGNLLKDSNIMHKNSRILAFKSKPPPPPEGFEKNVKLIFETVQSGPAKRSKIFRHIPQSAERTLDAPELLDDYYLNLLDWSSRNVVAVALGNTVYLWHASSGCIEELMQVGEDDGPVTGVSWGSDGKHIAVGLDNGDVQLWDSTAFSKVRTMKGHTARVGSLAWNGGPILSSGSRDNSIFSHDVRIRDHLTTKMCAHEQEVCGLKWSLSGQQLASGGNDNLLHVWDVSMMSSGAPSTYLHRFDDHQAAVKALAWCPFQSNLLASGGGTADRCIKFWNTQTGVCLNSVDTNSQVCALQWSRHEKELLSSHGFSQNQLCLWKYPSMVKMAELRGHTSRVLHLAQSPDGYTVASAAGDETLRFWQVFGTPDNSKQLLRTKSTESSTGINTSSCTLIR
ncbi:hypothetical protein GOP47_0000844 [Adiantum capillus-veneris]|uniref:CDC20/Fizzy WD40 domain-containing protein n=1 Tax=Adiantum capillus-veneris TaxID=13818 RepID=A0A9D4VDR8_ADICA|nr:hypothetical protein GOP47_0000844 [Adiantum capillus-veneris]